jgi:hypothetical protein
MMIYPQLKFKLSKIFCVNEKLVAQTMVLLKEDQSWWVGQMVFEVLPTAVNKSTNFPQQDVLFLGIKLP